MAKIKMVCPDCGSDNIQKDANVCWDIDEQDWVLAGAYDSETCADCGHEGDDMAERVELPEG